MSSFLFLPDAIECLLIGSADKRGVPIPDTSGDTARDKLLINEVDCILQSLRGNCSRSISSLSAVTHSSNLLLSIKSYVLDNY